MSDEQQIRSAFREMTDHPDVRAAKEAADAAPVLDWGDFPPGTPESRREIEDQVKKELTRRVNEVIMGEPRQP